MSEMKWTENTWRARDDDAGKRLGSIHPHPPVVPIQVALQKQNTVQGGVFFRRSKATILQ